MDDYRAAPPKRCESFNARQCNANDAVGIGGEEERDPSNAGTQLKQTIQWLGPAVLGWIPHPTR